MLRILIAGCGYVGTELGLRLAKAGHEVWGLRRDVSRLPSAIRPICADLLAPLHDVELPSVDRVVYAASADAATEACYRDAYVVGVRNLLREIETLADPPVRFLYVSSTAVYGDAGGGWVEEGTQPAPVDYRGSEVLRGEELVRRARTPGVCVRLGGIYGPGRTRLLERARSRELRCPPGPTVWSNRIHRDDAAGSLQHVLLLDDPEPVYLAVDDEPASLCEVYRHVAALVGSAEPGTGPFARRTRSNKRCSNERLKASGYAFSFPTYREGYRALAGAAAGVTWTDSRRCRSRLDS